jgi:transposase
MLDTRLNGTGGHVAQRAVGERSEVAPGSTRRPDAPDPELVERPSRRRFTAEYKLGILRAADACSKPGEIGALLRREGLSTSHLCDWRRQREEGALASLDRPRGRRKPNPLESENAELRRRLERSEADLAKARKVIEVQGNVSALLGELVAPGSADDDRARRRRAGAAGGHPSRLPRAGRGTGHDLPPTPPGATRT